MNSHKIKIVYIVDFFRTINAGTERQIGHLLAHLPDAGCSVQLISLQDSPFIKDELPQKFQNVKFISLGAQSDISKSLPTLIELYSNIRTNKPDIVHTFFPASNSFGVIFSKIAGVKSVISSRRDMGYNLTRKDIFLLKIANQFVSCVVANSNAVKEQTINIEGMANKKIHVIQNGINLAELRDIKKNDNPREPVVGVVANINRSVKRVDLFIKAAAIIHEKHPHVKFLIIGDGSLRKDLETLASSLGLNSHLLFMGRREDVQRLLKKISIAVICSDSEGFSNSIMEYMAAGLPVVATNVGGNPELVVHGKTGLLVPSNDAGALVESIQKLLVDPTLALKMGSAGREFLEKQFDIDRMLRQTKGLYQSFLNA